MIVQRKWSNTKIEIDKRWFKKNKIAKHRIYQIWDDADLFPCDNYGVRIPVPYSDISERYFSLKKSEKKIFCFGGSTTFGWFVNYKHSYPVYLDNILKNYSVFNLGVPGSDVRQSLYLLIDMLRINLIPDMVIFLDGINEKQAFSGRALESHSVKTSNLATSFQT